MHAKVIDQRPTTRRLEPLLHHRNSPPPASVENTHGDRPKFRLTHSRWSRNRFNPCTTHQIQPKLLETHPTLAWQAAPVNSKLLLTQRKKALQSWGFFHPYSSAAPCTRSGQPLAVVRVATAAASVLKVERPLTRMASSIAFLPLEVSESRRIAHIACPSSIRQFTVTFNWKPPAAPRGVRRPTVHIAQNDSQML